MLRPISRPALVATLVIVILFGSVGRYVLRRQLHTRSGAVAPVSTAEPPSLAPPEAKLAYLVSLAGSRPGPWEPGSGIVSSRFIESMTPEVFTSAPWSAPTVPMTSLLDVVEQSRRLFIQSPRLFGAMSFAADEAGLREPTLEARARGIADVVRHEFIAFQEQRARGFQKPPAPRADRLNPAVVLHGATFVMGADDVFTSEHRVQVSGFAMQRHEVTNEEYLRFDPSHQFHHGKERYPADSVSWYDAQAYAAWLGGSLPTEAQWEFAARGKAGRRYPWGMTIPTPARANFLARDGEPHSEPVESHPRGSTPEGVQDLAGSVWEWCRDWFEIYRTDSAVIVDPIGPERGTGRVLRGGSYYYDETLLKAAIRNNDLPASQYLNYGFRVVFREAVD